MFVWLSVACDSINICMIKQLLYMYLYYPSNRRTYLQHHLYFYNCAYSCSEMFTFSNIPFVACVIKRARFKKDFFVGWFTIGPSFFPRQWWIPWGWGLISYKKFRVMLKSLLNVSCCTMLHFLCASIDSRQWYVLLKKRGPIKRRSEILRKSKILHWGKDAF